MGLNLIFCLLLLIITSIATALPSSSTSSSSTSSHETIDPKITIQDQPAPRYQVFYPKNTPPFFLDRDGQGVVTKNKKKNSRMAIRKRSKIKSFKTSPFSVMLPKGFVPPSGSSPCHNDKPNFRVAFYCDLSTTKKP